MRARRLGDDLRGRAVTGERWRAALLARGWLLAPHAARGADDSEPAQRVRAVTRALEALEGAEAAESRGAAPPGIGGPPTGARPAMAVAGIVIAATTLVGVCSDGMTAARAFPWFVLAVPAVWGVRLWRALRAHARASAAAREAVLAGRDALARAIGHALARPFAVPNGDEVAWCDAEEDTLRATAHGHRLRGAPDAAGERALRAREHARHRTCEAVRTDGTGRFIEVTPADLTAADAEPQATDTAAEEGLSGVEALPFER